MDKPQKTLFLCLTSYIVHVQSEILDCMVVAPKHEYINALVFYFVSQNLGKTKQNCTIYKSLTN